MLDPLGLFFLFRILTSSSGNGSAPSSDVPAAGPSLLPTQPVTPFPVAPPDALPSWPSGWEADDPPPPEVVARAWALLPTLWARGVESTQVEMTGGRWITYVSRMHGNLRGVEAFRVRGSPAVAPSTSTRLDPGGSVWKRPAATATPPAPPPVPPPAAAPAAPAASYAVPVGPPPSRAPAAPPAVKPPLNFAYAGKPTGQSVQDAAQALAAVNPSLSANEQKVRDFQGAAGLVQAPGGKGWDLVSPRGTDGRYGHDVAHELAKYVTSVPPVSTVRPAWWGPPGTYANKTTYPGPIPSRQG